MPILDDGTSVANAAAVDADHNLRVNTPGVSALGVAQNGGSEAAGAVAIFGEVDTGEKTGARLVRSPEVDADYRLRAAKDTPIDYETFNYTAQNTGKFSHVFTTLTATVSAAGLLLNSGNIVTTTTGMTFGTQAEFNGSRGATSVYCEQNVAFTAASVPANVVVDFGMFRRGASTAFAPTDGVYFRNSPAGFVGVANRGGVETTTGVFDFTPVANQNYNFTISITEKRILFWIDDVLYGTVENSGVGQPFTSTSLPWSVRFAIVGGAAGAAFQALITDYTVTVGGPDIGSTHSSALGNRIFGSYQGLSGGTMGGLATYANGANPTAAVPSNTALTANLLAGLGGQVIETDTLAVNVDGIIMSYQVPAGTLAVQGRRLVVKGVKIDTFVYTALTGGGYNEIWTLNFGHTAVSLATGESASFATGTTKARRVVPLGSRTVASGLVALTQLPTISLALENPVYVNAGEFIAIAKRKVGTAPSAGAMFHLITLDYGWE